MLVTPRPVISGEKMELKIKRLHELVQFVSDIGKKSDNLLVFRGEKKDYGQTALVPHVYRDSYLRSEDIIYRESQRFNDAEFNSDIGVFDRLSRIQHYKAPTRLIDVSEDLFSSMYFAIGEKDIAADTNDAIVYIFEIDKTKVKFYDSDTVSVISNLAKIPLANSSDKSKEALLRDALQHINDIASFNNNDSAKFLLHEIKHEKPQFANIINPQHLTSIQFVLPKLTSNRVRSQKGAFLLFGMSPANFEAPIKLMNKGKLNKIINNVNHPVLEIHKAYLQYPMINDMQKELLSIGIKKSFIYPEIDKVSEFLKKIYQ